ncbi:hypothetical protein B484DRAFT_452132 [Ochromonadaceae sp. CCMP2298]|nr:hypothetical protein B484DRAFT_452132 [Ochromonadaceae sp. CCMP2298]|mmetsp:Transcript_82/g.123  ORF Transcript_82/g.123 Transcript_82/m.123 type:complete len:186 (+) Transcript_82:104-661(+)
MEDQPEVTVAEVTEEQPVATETEVAEEQLAATEEEGKAISSVLGFTEGDVPEESEVWEKKFEGEDKEKKDSIRKSLVMAGFSESEQESMLMEEAELWEKKVDQEINERKTEIATTLKFLGVDTNGLDLDSLDEETWEKKAETEKPLDDAFLSTHPRPTTKRGSLLNSFLGIFSFPSRPAPAAPTS